MSKSTAEIKHIFELPIHIKHSIRQSVTNLKEFTVYFLKKFHSYKLDYLIFKVIVHLIVTVYGTSISLHLLCLSVENVHGIGSNGILTQPPDCL